jgi:non-specific serine/threonine protein kinase
MVETLGHYKILDRIGAGGIGEVYRARDTNLGRTVAIKVLAPDVAGDPARRERFMHEARAAMALSHPSIAALFEIGEDQGQLFLVFEFVPGETLQTVVAGRALNPRRAIDFAVQIADALAEAHAEGIIHRDINPANVIITPKDKAKVLDFGLATWTAGGAEREHAAQATRGTATGTGATLGTLAYVSPEQALGEEVDQRTDIFSAGVVLFEMLTGRLPFTGPTPAAIAQQIVQAPAPPLSSVDRSLPKELEPILGRMLAKGLEQRYESAATLAAELRAVGAVLDTRSDAAAPLVVPAASAPRGRSLGRFVVWLLLVGVGGAAAWYGRDAIERLWRRTIGPSPAPLIAVLPFELAEPDASRTYFADGLTEDLMSRLGQTPGLTVLGRSSTRNYRGRPAADIARELGASVVLAGSIGPGDDAMKISLELIDPRDGTGIWTGQYTKNVKDVFAVQAQMAGDVASALRVSLQPTRARAVALSRVVDQRAYDLYLRGRQATAEHRLPQAITYYEQAIAADAGLGEGFAGMAEALHLQTAHAEVPDDGPHRERLQSAAKRSYEVDPDLPQANVAMGLGSDALADALKHFRRAIELDPSNAGAYHLVGVIVDDFDSERALAFFRKSVALDSRFDPGHTAIADALWRLGRDDDAKKELTSVASTGDGSALLSRALADLHSGRHAEAATELAAMSNLRSTPPYWAALVAALRLAGRPDDALTEATTLAARFPRDCEAKVVLAALRLERRETAAAHKLADGSLALANVESPLPSDIRCGLHAAAALQNGPRAAALLDRVSASEPALRAFAQMVAGRSGTMWIDARVYPWSLIARQPVVAEARERLDAAYARERETARAVLSGLP